MVFSINFGLKLAAGLLSLLLFFLSLKNFHLRSNHLLPYLSLVQNLVLAATVSATLSYFEIYPDPMSDVTRDVLEGIYTIMHSFLPYLLLLYMWHMFGITCHHDLKFYVLFSLPLFFLEIAIFINFFYPILYVYQDHTYTRLNGWCSIVIVTAFYYLLTYIFTFFHRKALPMGSFAFLMAAYSLPLIGIAIQMFAGVKAELFSESLSLLLLFFTLENKDGEIDFTLDSYNQEALHKEIRGRVAMKQKFTLIDIRLLSSEGTFTFLTEEEKQKLGRNVIEELRKRYLARNVFALGNDHFVLFLFQKDEKQAEEEIAPLRNLLEKDYLIYPSLTLPITLALTLLSYPDPIESQDDMFRYLLLKTPENLPIAKPLDTETNFDKMRRTVLIEEEIQTALEKKRFTLDYQPIYQKGSATPNALEAFLRLRDPILGWISPNELLPITEKNQTIREIGKEALEIACQFYVENHLEEKGIESIFLKVSMTQLREESMAGDFLNICKRSGMPPERIVLELTPDRNDFNDIQIKGMFAALRSYGFRLVFDNFGDGSTNLIQVLHSSILGVKIDQKILSSSMKDENRRHLLKYIFQALKSNGKIVYQSGVETQEEKDFALTYGVDYLQGYYYVHPLPEDRLLAFLDERGVKA